MAAVAAAAARIVAGIRDDASDDEIDQAREALIALAPCASYRSKLIADACRDGEQAVSLIVRLAVDATRPEAWPSGGGFAPASHSKSADATAAAGLSSATDGNGLIRKKKGVPKRKRTPQRDNLLALVGDDVELWRDRNGEAHATFPINGHRENREIRSREFKQWLSLAFFDAHGGTLGGQAMEDALRVLEAKAGRRTVYRTYRRVGRHGSSIYLDLVDDRWRAVEITSARWRVVKEAPVKFLRSPAMRLFPNPRPAG